MGLRDVARSKETVHAATGSFEVSGLSLEKISVLIKDDEELTNQLMSGKISLSDLLQRAPKLVASIIGAASDEKDEEGRKLAENLPAGVQLDALSKIYDLTVPDERAMGKLIERLDQLLPRAAESDPSQGEGDSQEPASESDTPGAGSST